MTSCNETRDPSIEELQSMMDKLIVLFHGTFPEESHRHSLFPAFVGKMTDPEKPSQLIDVKSPDAF